MRYRCNCPEYEERPCDNPNEELECEECQHGKPEENGWRFCPACGREIVIADETSELTKKQWDWIMGRFSRAE